MASLGSVPITTTEPSISRHVLPNRRSVCSYVTSKNFTTHTSWLKCRNSTRLFCVGSNGRQKNEKENENEKKQQDSEQGWDLEKQVEKMLGDMESQALMQDLNAAVERVAKARKELDALEEAQRRAERVDTDSLVEECQRDVFSAEMDLRNAEIALIKARAGSSVWDMTEMSWADKDEIDEDAERLESGKVAAVSSVVGTLAGVPFFAAASLDGPELAVGAGFVLISCAVFGLTYRYAIRRDLGNTQLKAGCVAAFALVRGLGQIETSNILLGLPYVSLDNILQGSLFVAESIAIFSFAAIALEYCFRERLLSPFPLKARP